MKNRRTITFNIGDENRIVVEDINKDIIKSSIFSEPYHYILNALDHYLMRCLITGTIIKG